MISPNPEVFGQPSDLACPVCEEKLWVLWEGDEVVLYCPHGPCPDSRMNDGAKAETLEEAFQKLVAKSYES